MTIHYQMHKFLILISFIFLSCRLFAYQPAKDIDILQIQSIKNSNLIFLGEPVAIDWVNNLATFKIFDIYKGEYKFDTIVFSISFEENTGFFSQTEVNYRPDIFKDFQNTGSIDKFESYKGLWIVYLYEKENSKLHLYRDLSRSIQHPERLFIWPYIDKLNDSNYDKSQLRIDAINDWFLEIERLKKLRERETTRPKKSDYWIGISIILSVVNLIILICLLAIKKTRP